MNRKERIFISFLYDYSYSIGRSRNWEEMINLSIDPELAREIHYRNGAKESDEVCSMCGEFCAIKLLKDALESKKKQKN